MMEHFFHSACSSQKWRNGQWCKKLQTFDDGMCLVQFRNGDVIEAYETELS